MSGSRPFDENASGPLRSAVEPVNSGPGGPAAPGARRWRSAELFGPAQEIEIEHGQAIYRLRQTSLGKLILTK